MNDRKELNSDSLSVEVGEGKLTKPRPTGNGSVNGQTQPTSASLLRTRKNGG